MALRVPPGVVCANTPFNAPLNTVAHKGCRRGEGELRVAASLKLALIVVVFCDNGLNRIELKQMARHYPSWGTRIDPTDIALLAQAMGCDGVNVDSVRGLEAALAAPRSADRPLVIGATIDPSQYGAQF